MKELIFRDLYLIRKNLLITFGIFAGFILFGLIGILSAKYGNIAKYATDKQTPIDVMQASLYFGLIGGCIVTTGVEHIFSLIKKDYEIHWHDYLSVSGKKSEVIVGAKYLIITMLFLLGLGIGLLGLRLMQVISGVESTDILHSGLGRHEGPLILILMSVMLLLVGNESVLMQYIYKGKESKKADAITAFIIFVLVVASMALFFLLELNENAMKYVLNLLKYLSHHVAILYVIPLVLAVLMTLICYLISVRIVKKEGKRI